MSKGTKIILFVMIFIICIDILTVVCKKYIKIPENNVNEEKQQNDIQASKYTYNLSSGDRDVTLYVKSENETTTFIYNFDDSEKVSSIQIIETCASSGDAQIYYNGINENSNLKEIYSDIKIEDNIVTVTLKQEYVDYHSSFSKEDIYKMQEETIKNNG